MCAMEMGATHPLSAASKLALARRERIANRRAPADTGKDFFQSFISFDDLFVYKGKYGDLRFYSHGKETVVVDGEDREVATLDFPDVFCTESQIYSIKDKSLYVINKEQLY